MIRNSKLIEIEEKLEAELKDLLDQPLDRELLKAKIFKVVKHFHLDQSVARPEIKYLGDGVFEYSLTP